MRIMIFISALIFFGLNLPLGAQEWSPYVPGQVSYFAKSNGSGNVNHGVRALDTLIQRDTYKVYYFKSGVWPCQYHGAVDCSHVRPPDSMIFSNGTYFYPGSDKYVNPPDISYFFEDTAGRTWTETNIPLDVNEYVDTVTFRIDSVFVDSIFGMVDSFKSISRSFPGASPIIISKKFGLVKGDLRIPYHNYDPEYGLPMSFFNMPDSLIGVETNDTSLGTQPPNALDLFPYKVGTKLKWDHYHDKPTSYSSWESIDSITSIDTTNSKLIVHHQTVSATKNGLDTTQSATTYDLNFLEGILRNQMNYYRLDCADSTLPTGYKIEVLKKDTLGPDPPYTKLEYFNVHLAGTHHWVDTGCQFVPGIYNKGYVEKETYIYDGRFGFKGYNHFYYIGGPTPPTTKGVSLIAYQSPTDSFGTLSPPEYVSGIGNNREALNTKVFPNPVHNQLKIEVPQLTGKVHFQIFSSIGQPIRQGTFFSQTTLDVSSLPGGIYIIRIVANDKEAIKKIIKQ